MPTIPASDATLPRMASAMARTSCSGSGNGAGMSGMVEVALQDDLGGDGVDAVAALAFADAAFGFHRGEGLVHEHHGLAVARGESPAELRGELRHLVHRTVRVLRLAD